MSKKDYYETLNLSKSASESEIKKAYRKLAIKFHPDKNKGDKNAEQKFKEAAEAYEVLSNPQKRQQYDQFGHSAFSGGQGFSGGGMSMDDIFDHFGDVFGSSFGGGFGGRRGGQRVRKGSNLRVKLRLSLEDIVNGVQKKIKVQKLVAASGVEFSTCSSCNGSGQVTRVTNTILGAMQTSSTCPNCKGSGQMISKRPSGVDASGLEKKETIIEIEIPETRLESKAKETVNKVQSGKYLVTNIVHDMKTNDYLMSVTVKRNSSSVDLDKKEVI